ncbi:MAG: hypothetical protein ABEJ56_00025 [Candidatus Nanohaloarchaea archaeon]
MTEETPLQDIENYQFPDKYFSELKEAEENDPYYSIVQGGLYDSMRNDSRFSNKQATKVSRLLNNGKISQAEELVNKELE